MFSPVELFIIIAPKNRMQLTCVFIEYAPDDQTPTAFYIRLSKSTIHGRSNGLYNEYAIMLGGFRGHAPWINKNIFASSDFLTASASRRYFNKSKNKLKTCMPFLYIN